MSDRPDHDAPESATRRSLLLNAGFGLGALALGDLMGMQDARAANKGILGAGRFPARAKRIIWMHMWGAVSQVDSFDYKPLLTTMHGQEIPPSVKNKGGRISAMSNAQASFPLVKPIRDFRQRGQCGLWISDLFPYTARVADELCLIRSVQTEHVNHDPAAKFLHTGFQLSGRPSAGAWVNYALGADNSNLPSFMVLASLGTPAGQNLDSSAFGAGFLPSQYQGVQLRSGADPVLYVGNPEGLDRNGRREQLDLINGLSLSQHALSQDPEILARAAQYEMSYRMQDSVPEVADISKEPKHVLDLYGPDVHKPGSFARNCLLARRLAERDVKFTQLIHVGWDHHSNLERGHPVDAAMVDRGCAALVLDLKQRGLLDDTLVVWGSEFGRTAFAQGQISGTWGRDHHGGCFTYWMAGAGVKAGSSYGATDDFSYNIVSNPMPIHDLQATILYMLGIDHKELTFHYQGRDFRLTDVAGTVHKGILA